MPSDSLSSTSYVVLGLVGELQPASVYDMKKFLAARNFNFTSISHTVLYTETESLAKLGMLDWSQAPGERRRRTYRLTDAGLAALESWRAEPTDEPLEVKDAALVKLFFGGDRKAISETQRAVRRARLDECLTMREQLIQESAPEGRRLALDALIGIESALLRFWAAVADDAEASLE